MAIISTGGSLSLYLISLSGDVIINTGEIMTEDRWYHIIVSISRNEVGLQGMHHLSIRNYFC